MRKFASQAPLSLIEQ